MQDFTPEGTPDHTYMRLSVQNLSNHNHKALIQSSYITVSHKLETAFCIQRHGGNDEYEEMIHAITISLP